MAQNGDVAYVVYQMGTRHSIEHAESEFRNLLSCKFRIVAIFHGTRIKTGDNGKLEVGCVREVVKGCVLPQQILAGVPPGIGQTAYVVELSQ